MSTFIPQRITFTSKAHGTFAIHPGELDRAISKYLPASAAQLRAEVSERTGTDYSDVFDVGAFLIILADLDGMDPMDPDTVLAEAQKAEPTTKWKSRSDIIFGR